MRIDIRSILIDLVRGGAGPHLELDRRVSRVLYDVLEPLKVPGLKDLASVWVFAPAKKPEPVSILGLRYSAKTQKASCRFLLSPVAPTDDARGWRRYRQAFVREIEGLMDELLTTLEARLKESGRDADLAPVRATLHARFSTLARELAAEETPAKKPRPEAASAKKGTAATARGRAKAQRPSR